MHIHDNGPRLYLANGSSTKSERNAFDKAMLAGMDVDVKSIRLDRYCSFSTYVDKFDDSCSNAKEEFHTQWLTEVEGYHERI